MLPDTKEILTKKQKQDHILARMRHNYRSPFRYDNTGQMIFDANNQMCLDVRGAGRVGYEEWPDEIQDLFGKLVVDALNEKFETL